MRSAARISCGLDKRESRSEYQTKVTIVGFLVTKRIVCLDYNITTPLRKTTKGIQFIHFTLHRRLPNQPGLLLY
ncbi:hypothetical protein RIF29_40494 [Crotalaria pallida]|uniref:Uncharacterized protein n=1 Tax=Crotalaria pallida TaxID=3830 RepID=A0AAN9E404_CROPI